MVGQIERFFYQAVEIDRAALAAAAARMLQHALDDAVGPPAVLGDLFEIAGQHLDDFADFGAGVVVECRDAGIGGFLQLVEQFDREAGKVVDEV